MFIPCFIGSILGKMVDRKNFVKSVKLVRSYRGGLSIEGALNLLHTMLWTIVLWTKSDKYSISASWVYMFFVCYLAALWSTFGLYWGDSLCYLMLITGHWECCNKVGFLSQADVVWGPDQKHTSLVLVCHSGFKMRTRVDEGWSICLI